MVLERVEIAHLGTGVHRDPRDLAGRVRVIRGELALGLGDREAATAGREHDGPGSDLGRSCPRQERSRPPAVGRLELQQLVVRELVAGPRLVRLAKGFGDRMLDLLLSALER